MVEGGYVEGSGPYNHSTVPRPRISGFSQMTGPISIVAEHWGPSLHALRNYNGSDAVGTPQGPEGYPGSDRPHFALWLHVFLADTPWPASSV